MTHIPPPFDEIEFGLVPALSTATGNTVTGQKPDRTIWSDDNSRAWRIMVVQFRALIPMQFGRQADCERAINAVGELTIDGRCINWESEDVEELAAFLAQHGQLLKQSMLESLAW